MNKVQIQRYFNMAKNVSELSDYTQFKLGAVIVYKNRIVSAGWNVKKENPLQKKYNHLRGFDVDKYVNSLHAEMYAIIKARDLDINWEKASIFIYRQLRDGTKALAKPCPACEKAIKDLGIKNVYYTGKNKYVHETFD